MKQKIEDMKQIRLSRVLELYSQCKTEREIAQALKVSPATVHRDIVELREEAVNGLEGFIESVPFQWTRAITSFDLLIRQANNLLDSEEIDNIALIKLIAELTKGRLDLYSAPEILKRMVERERKFRAKIEQLQHSQARYEVVSEIVQEAGKPNTVNRTLKRVSGKNKKEEELPAPVV